MIDAPRSSYPEDLLREAHRGQDQFESIAEDLVESVKRYAREKPSAALLWALGIGFVLGWKLKPW
ncbi:MAG TPA: hypothetical protein VGZ22_12310 [Isosphaeraceae bacterium]|jgi:hypothetical protein|nr:hypothetical protein [Isosphaeraceae bacterium]